MSNTSKVDEESDEESKLLVVDPDDYRQTRQLKQIHNAKEDYSKLKTTEEGISSGTHLQRVRGLILELEPLMKRLDTQNDYLQGVHLGSVLDFEEDVHIEYDKKIGELVDTKSEAIELAKSKGYAKEVDIVGLETLLESGGFRTYDVDMAYGIDNVSRLTSEFQVFGPQICDKAYRYCREFIAEADLGLQVEEDTGPAQI